MQKLKLWVLTVCMTFLIWFAADQRVTRSIEIVIPFSVTSAAPGVMAVKLADQSLAFIKVEIRGPNNAIAEARASQEKLRAELQISERDSGRYELNLVEELRTQMDQFPDGLVVLSAYPATVTVEADRYLEKVVPLRVNMGDYQFLGVPQLDPAEVKVRVPERRFERLSPDQQSITIPVSKLLGGELAEGRTVQKSIAVPPELDGGLTALHVEPQRVTLTATPLKVLSTYRIPTVIIRVQPVTPSLFDRHRVVFVEQPEADFVTRPVSVRGPTDIISNLSDNPSRFAVAGFVVINREDIRDGKSSGPIPKEVQIVNLPKGVEVDEKPEVVYIELVPRS